jgi:hypothetical protein
MEEIYILEDGSQVDISDYSQFEKTNFLLKNPGAKKTKGATKSAVVVPKKNQALNKDTESKSKTGSSVSQKQFRLPQEQDFQIMQQKRGLLPPPSATATSYEVPTAENLYDLQGNIGVKKKSSKYKTEKITIPGQEPTREWKDSFLKLQKKSKAITPEELRKELYDLKPSGERVNSEEEIRNVRKKINQTDSDLEHPYLYYSIEKQKQSPDTFVQDNYNIKELSEAGINVQDFDGFLNKKGYKEDFIKKQSQGLFEGKGDNIHGYDVQLANELAKKKMMDMYMEDMQRRDFVKQDLYQEIPLIMGDIKEKSINKNQIFDQNKTLSYIEKNFPTLTKKLKEKDKENARLYEEAKSGGTDFFSWDTLGKIGSSGWNAISDRLVQTSAIVYDVLGMEETAEGARMLDEQNQFLKPNDRGVSYVSGKTVEDDGTKYIVDRKGEIYDADSKIVVTDLFNEKKYNELVEKSKFGQSDYIFSVQGAAVQTSGVMADMLVQAALSRGIGAGGAIASEARVALNATRQNSKVVSVLNDSSKLLRKIPMDRATGYSMIAQGTLGYTQGYEDTLKAAREAGINDKEAFKLATNAGQRMAILYSTTGVINPQTNVADNIFGSKNLINKAIQQYTKTGEKGFVKYFDDIIKNTPRNLIEFAEEGGKEVIQENIQQAGEIGINRLTNIDAGKKIMNEVMSGDDFMNTSILSFISSGLISKAKIPTFFNKDNAKDDLRALSTLSKNKNEFEKVITNLVDSKVFTQEQSDKLKEDVNIYTNNSNKVPKNISAEIAMPVMRELDKIRKLNDQKKGVDKAFHEEIDEQIDDTTDKIKKMFYADRLRVKNEQVSNAIKKGVVKNTQMLNFATTNELRDYLKTEMNMSDADATYMAKQGGFMLDESAIRKFSKDPSSVTKGQKLLFVNEAVASTLGTTEVGRHEFLHGLIFETIKDSPEAQQLLGKALSMELMKMKDLTDAAGKGEIPLPKSFVQRFGQYVNKYQQHIAQAKAQLELGSIDQQEYDAKVDTYLGNQWEEVLTLYSDAISSGQVKYDEGVFVKLKDTVRRVLQYLGLKDVEFKSGKDVYNFIKDYNKSMDSGNWGKAMKKVGNQGAMIDIESLRKETKASKTKVQEKSKSDFQTDAKFSLGERKSSEEIKKDINSKYNKEQWSQGHNDKGENQNINRVLYDILSEYDYIIKGKSKGLGYNNLPDFSEMDMVSETQLALIPHIRNFNKEFFQKREEYKKELESKGLDPKSKEFKDKVEAQDEKGYQGKKGIVKENKDLNAWINSQLLNKMKVALNTGNVTTQKFTEDIEGEMFKETKIIDGYGGDESYLMDEGDNIFEQQNDYEVEQSELVTLLSDPIFRFVDEDGELISIETVPFGSFYVTEVSDPTIAANKKLRTETDPKIIEELKNQLKDLERGLELQQKEELTFEEKEELKSLKSFKSYDLSTGMMVNTFKALSVQDVPAKIITDEVSREILRSPNIETLEYRNFKEKLSDLSKTMSRRMTFKNGPEIESFMYNNWELIYDVINHPVDPVTGQSSYASKKLPPRLKEFDEKGNLKKIDKITRVKFLQSFYGIEEATRIINTYGGKNASKELVELEEQETNEKTGRGLVPTAYFDRRTALMELFGDVMVLQEARRLLRQPDFLESIKSKNVNLYNELKDDITRTKVLNDMAKGKSDIVKFSLAEEQNGDISTFLGGLLFGEQWVVARDIDSAILKSKIPDGTKVTFKVPSRSKFSDKSTAYFIISKIAEGYNDFEFTVKKNANGPLTKQVLDALDQKSKKYQETLDMNNNLERTMNEIIEVNKGVSAEEKISPETAKNLGKNVGKYDIFLPPEDEDFLGLLYTLASAKGLEGEKQMKFLVDNLLKPYSDAMLNLMRARQTMYKDWKELVNKKHKGISKVLKQDSGYGGYLVDQAVRVYLWSAAGYEIPGLDKKDLFNLREVVRTNKQLRDFAQDVSLLSKQANGYIEPDHNWGLGSVVGDMNNIISKTNRKKYLEHWQHNADKIFSKDNMSKIEAVYGRGFAKSLDNMLKRMKSGTNRTEGASDTFLNWINGSTAVTMFLNMRSAVLQTISSVNFINTTDNNILKAGKALLNVPQYMEDFYTIWNSEYLKDRRSGLMNDVAEAELAQMMNDPRNKSVLDKFKSGTYWLLKNGFMPTRLADSFAISFGGAGFYRNRIKTYLKQGETQEEAHHLTMRDFYEISEVSQQSADVSKISMNQSSIKGRLVLAFQNTPLQYSRIIKKSVVDLVKGRGSAPNNIAKIVYYSTIQNMLFNFMQNALFSMFWDDEDEEGKYESASMRAVNGTMDTLLRGAGFKGALLATVKNAIVKWYEKSGDPKGYGDVLLEFANVAPSIGIKARSLVKSYKAVEYNRDEITYKGFSTDNTYAIEALTSLTSAGTNVPVDRIYQKVQNVSNAMNSDFETWQRVAFLLGYNKYNLGLKDESKPIKMDSKFNLNLPGVSAPTLKLPNQ